MDEISQIKMRLPIEELVASYCQLQKKGRNFVALCPFHTDSRPSLLVSPDKGIAYCFACQTGGDIFSFYQAIEGVDFPQAIKDLAERTGVQIQQRAAQPVVKKDEKERARDCLTAALTFYRAQLSSSQTAKQYLESRAIQPALIEKFSVGVAPDSFSATYEHLLKVGFSRKEILQAGLGVQRELGDDRMYDRFRNRLMFPIYDTQGAIVGFGGRTLGQDDAKYINSSDGILYHKSQVLFGLHLAREAMRDARKVIIVEGYFDVLACHAVGITHVVAPCGTALTEEQVRLLKRYCDTAVLCFDQDAAGRDATERAFSVLAHDGMQVETVVLPQKDPAELLQSEPEKLKELITTNPVPYIDRVLEELLGGDLSSASGKRAAFDRLLPLLSAMKSGIERSHYLERAAKILDTMGPDLERSVSQQSTFLPQRQHVEREEKNVFSSSEIALGIFMHYPTLRNLLSELIPPTDPFCSALYVALKKSTIEDAELESLDLPQEHAERVSILWLYGEQHGFSEWSDSLAIREIRSNCTAANREMVREKQLEITKQLLTARSSGNRGEEAQLLTQYQQLLKLMKKAA